MKKYFTITQTKNKQILAFKFQKINTLSKKTKKKKKRNFKKVNVNFVIILQNFNIIRILKCLFWINILLKRKFSF